MKKLLLLAATAYLIQSCSEDSSSFVVAGGWLIPESEVFNGGPGKDGIPAIENPNMVSINEIHFMVDDDLVVVFSNGGQAQIYPHKILDWHEIVNDNNVTISYCPLTGSAIGLSPNLQDGTIETTFGVSGMLYNSNLILYDRFSDSYWSQMTNQCVAGSLKGTFPKNEVLAETTYRTAIDMFPDARVLSNNTGIYSESQYAHYPYGGYKENNDYLLFPVNNTDNRVPNKERVLGVVINGNTLIFRYKNNSAGINITHAELAGNSIIVVSDSGKDYAVAYKNNLSGSSVPLSFTALQGNAQAVFADNIGNIYNILGRVVTGPNSGERLQGTHSYIAFWFAWAAFYPDLQIN